MEASEPDIFQYTDYRAYLRDAYRFRKSLEPSFTHRHIAAAVGFKSSGLFTQILQGKTNITPPLVEGFAQVLGLKPRAKRYFELMVTFDQASTHKARKETFEALTGFRPPAVRLIEGDLFEFYSKWWYSALRALLAYHPHSGASGEEKELAEALCPAITPGQAKKAVELLERLGFILKSRGGRYRVAEAHLTAGDKVRSTAITGFQQQVLDLGKEALERFPRPQRHSSTLTLGISGEAYRMAVEKIAQLRRELVELAEKEERADRVIQFNFQAFPLTQPPREET